MFSVWRKISSLVKLRFSGTLWSVNTLRNSGQKSTHEKLKQCKKKYFFSKWTMDNDVIDDYDDENVDDNDDGCNLRQTPSRIVRSQAEVELLLVQT